MAGLRLLALTAVTGVSVVEVLDRAVGVAAALVPGTHVGIWLRGPGETEQQRSASDADALRLERLQTALGKGPARTAYETGDLVLVTCLATDERFGQLAAVSASEGVCAVVALPLLHDGAALGALTFYRDTPGELAPEDLAAARILVDVVSSCVVNARDREEARRVCDGFRDSSLRDPLTGLPNRLLLQERIAHIAQRGVRSRATAAVLFLDLDRFKLVNDTFGHAIGDGLLVAVGRRLAALLRPGDTLSRFSGDEFVVLCEDLAEAADATLLATRVSAAFERPFHVDGIQLLISASVGVAFAGPGSEITGQLLLDADSAMYRAKAAGHGPRHHTAPAARLGRTAAMVTKISALLERYVQLPHPTSPAAAADRIVRLDRLRQVLTQSRRVLGSADGLAADETRSGRAAALEASVQTSVLPSLLDQRRAIHQAEGMVMRRSNVTAQQARQLLAEAAREQQRTLHDIAVRLLQDAAATSDRNDADPAHHGRR